jgi:hypothetical protein
MTPPKFRRPTGCVSDVTKYEQLVVDDRGWSHTDMAAACRLILSTLRGNAAEYETDIPVTSADWPPDVSAAAEVLRDVASRNGRVEEGGYAQTGLVEIGSQETWSAFVAFAPWAYDATVWDGNGRSIVSLADEGQSITAQLELGLSQYGSIAGALGRERLVPAKEWSRSLKEQGEAQDLTTRVPPSKRVPDVERISAALMP